MVRRPTPPFRSGLSFDRMAIVLLFVALGLRAAIMPAQNDSFWHLRAGADIWRTGHVPLVETYSYTAAGAPYGDHEWLSQAAMYLCYRLGGMPGIEIAAGTILLIGLVFAYRLMVGPRLTRFALMALAAGVSSYGWVLRPQIVSLAALVILVWLLLRQRYWAVPPLFVLWANAHGGVIVGELVLSAAFMATWLRWRCRHETIDRRRLRALAVLLPLAAMAMAVTPLGFGIFAFALTSAGRGYALQIVEWLPLYPTDALGIMCWAIGLGFLFVLVKRRRALLAGSWSDWIVVAAALALFPLGVRSARNVSMFLILAAPATSRLLGPDFRFHLRRRGVERPAGPDHPRLNLAIAGAFGLAAAAAVGLIWKAAPKYLDWHPISDGALAALRGCDGPLYNHYDDGGYLIWFLPDKRVFVDSRQDPYPLPFLLEHRKIESGQASYRPLFDRWKIRCAFLPATSPTVRALTEARWITRFRDADWVVLAAPGTG
jgi:hypothetical protein